MIEELSKKDSYWRKIALKICGNKSLADDLVQDMYLKLYNCENEINDFYVIVVMRNLFIDTTKQKKHISIDTFDLPDNNNAFEYDDNEQELVSALKWYEKELIELSYDKPYREIQRELNINYKFVMRIVNKAKTKWEEKNMKA